MTIVRSQLFQDTQTLKVTAEVLVEAHTVEVISIHHGKCGHSQGANAFLIFLRYQSEEDGEWIDDSVQLQRFCNTVKISLCKPGCSRIVLAYITGVLLNEVAS